MDFLHMFSSFYTIPQRTVLVTSLTSYCLQTKAVSQRYLDIIKSLDKIQQFLVVRVWLDVFATLEQW